MSTAAQPTYPVRAVVRATGLSEHALRAWERRYALVQPIRSPGGSRRYRREDVERLRLVKAAIDRGHRVGDLARLTHRELRAISDGATAAASSPVDRVLTALGAFDEAEAERLIGGQLSALGPIEFCETFVSPLLRRIGDRWAAGALCVASEHLGSALVRSALGAALHAQGSAADSPAVIVAAPAGERHELGLLMASITIRGAGAHPCLLGSDVPAEEIVRSAVAKRAAAVAIGVTGPPTVTTRRAVAAVARQLPATTSLWLGGPSAPAIRAGERVERLGSLGDLEARARLLSAT